MIILAIKPQNLKEAIESCVDAVDTHKVIISIIAGVSTEKLEGLLPEGSKVIRVMPNTPALVGAGTSVLTGGKFATEEDLRIWLGRFLAVWAVLIFYRKSY